MQPNVSDERLWWERSAPRLNTAERERLARLLDRLEAAERRAGLAVRVLRLLVGRVEK